MKNIYNSKIYDRIAVKLVELRKEKGISQKEAAIQIGISTGSLSYYECGQRVPNIDVLFTLCRYYGVSLDYMVGFSGVKKPARDYDDASNAYEIGFSSDAINEFYNSPKLVLFLNRFIKSKSFQFIKDYILCEEEKRKDGSLKVITKLMQLLVDVNQSAVFTGETE